MYTGDWKFDKMNGRGTFRQTDGTETTGEYTND